MEAVKPKLKVGQIIMFNHLTSQGEGRKIIIKDETVLFKTAKAKKEYEQALGRYFKS